MAKISKMKRNEVKKLRAAYYNGMAIACFGVAGLGASIKLLNESESLLSGLGIAAVWILVGMVLSMQAHFYAVGLIVSLED